MKKAPVSISMTGICATWDTFLPAGALRRVQFAPTAFSRWLSTPEAMTTPILLQHRPDLSLQTGFSVLRWSPQGISVRFRMQQSRQFERDTVFALRHGRFSGLSIAWSVESSICCRDTIGRFDYITRAWIAEISICDRPANRRTSISFSLPAHGDTRTWTDPKSERDRSRLSEFLSRIGYEPPPRKPQPAALIEQPKPYQPKLLDWEIYVPPQRTATDDKNRSTAAVTDPRFAVE